MAMFFCLVLLLHFVGDFLCQTRQMANNKSSNNYWLAAHVTVYSFVLFLGLIYFFDIRNLILFVIANFFLHFITDKITSQFTSYFYKKNNLYGFFSIVGFDQFIHNSTLILLTEFILL